MTGNHVALGESAATRARVTFTAFRSVDDPMLMAWARFREPIAMTARQEGAAVHDGSGSSVRQAPPHEQGRTSGLWRLLATNNRELGRSFLLYGSFDAAHAHVRRLQACSADLEVTIVRGPFNASHGWVISYEGSPVMTCSRWYSSTSTSVSSAIGTLAALPGAVLSDDADRSAPSGRFSRRIAVREHVDSW